MNLILLSHPAAVKGEVQLLIQLFELGLQSFHLRKPTWTQKQVEQFIHAIPVRYRPLLHLHSHHRLAPKYGLGSIHFNAHAPATVDKMRLMIEKGVTLTKIEEVAVVDYRIDRIFFGPIFNSFHRDEYHCRFTRTEMQSVYNVANTRAEFYALGGIDESNIPATYELGFDGVVLFTVFWETFLASGTEQALDKFIQIQQVCEKMKEQPSTSPLEMDYRMREK